jgi:hypothetical protein
LADVFLFSLNEMSWHVILLLWLIIGTLHVFPPTKMKHQRRPRRDSAAEDGHHHLIEGFLLKRSKGLVALWQPRWFRTQGHYLLYAASEAAAQSVRCLPQALSLLFSFFFCFFLSFSFLKGTTQ